MSNLMPIEFKNQRILTTDQLAEVYETEPRRITENFSRNEKYFAEGIHYYLLQGDELREFKHEVAESVVAKNVNKLYLWTERGANRHCKILDTDKAWGQFDNLEETYFRVKEFKDDINQLSPQLQLLINMELEQKKLRHELIIAKEETAAIKEEVADIREVIEINPGAEWRKQTNNILNKICKKLNDYKTPKEEVYKALESRGKCKLKTRLDNLKGRALREGMMPSKVNQFNNLDVIANDVRLKEVYIAIVKELSIKYEVA